MSSVRLSEKYGVNPSICQCFWCGEDKNQLILLGSAAKRITGSEEAPMHGVYDLEPCDKCKEGMALGITIIEASPVAKPGWQQMSEGRWVSGTWAVITEEAFKRGFTGAAAEQTLKTRKCFMETALYDQVGLPRKDFDIRKEVPA